MDCFNLMVFGIFRRHTIIDMHLQGVSTKDLIRVRRLATRRRAAAACMRCKSAKIKCADNRPCKKCAESNLDCSEFKTEGSKSVLVGCRDIQGNSSSVSPKLSSPAILVNQIQENANFAVNVDQNKEIPIQVLQAGLDQPTKINCNDSTMILEPNAGRVHTFDSLQGSGSSAPSIQHVSYSPESARLRSYPKPQTFLPAMQMPSSMLGSNMLPCISATPATSHRGLLPAVATLLHGSWCSPPLLAAPIPPSCHPPQAAPQPSASLGELPALDSLPKLGLF